MGEVRYSSGEARDHRAKRYHLNGRLSALTPENNFS